MKRVVFVVKDLNQPNNQAGALASGLRAWHRDSPQGRHDGDPVDDRLVSVEIVDQNGFKEVINGKEIALIVVFDDIEKLAPFPHWIPLVYAADQKDVIVLPATWLCDEVFIRALGVQPWRG